MHPTHNRRDPGSSPGRTTKGGFMTDPKYSFWSLPNGEEYTIQVLKTEPEPILYLDIETDYTGLPRCALCESEKDTPEKAYDRAMSIFK